MVVFPFWSAPTRRRFGSRRRVAAYHVRVGVAIWLDSRGRWRSRLREGRHVGLGKAATRRRTPKVAGRGGRLLGSGMECADESALWSRRRVATYTEVRSARFGGFTLRMRRGFERADTSALGKRRHVAALQRSQVGEGDSLGTLWSAPTSRRFGRGDVSPPTRRLECAVSVGCVADGERLRGWGEASSLRSAATVAQYRCE